MGAIRIEDIQRDPARYLRRVKAGETLMITEAEQPIAELRPVGRTVSEPRPFGLCAGAFSVPDDFDAPLPEEIIRAFEGG